MSIRILPYMAGSQSARLLSSGLTDATGRRVLRLRQNSRWVPRRGDTVINWGKIVLPENLNNSTGYTLINRPEAVNNASNKLEGFRILRAGDCNVPDFTTDPETANSWACRFFGRKVRGTQGRDIVDYNPEYPYSEGGEYPAPSSREGTARPDGCDFYVKYIRKQAEYRVHVAGGDPFLYQQKRRRNGAEVGRGTGIRNHRNGWVYSIHNVDGPPESVVDNAVKAVWALGLDFGAVDIIYNRNREQAYVLEVNTAPGLVGETTLHAYVNMFSELFLDYID